MRLHKRTASSEEQRIIDSCPELDACGGDVLRCWRDLDSCRGIGMAVGPIPWTAIVQWAQLHRLDRQATILLADVIRYLDLKRAERENAKRTAPGA